MPVTEVARVGNSRSGRLTGRAGLTVPDGWWASPSLLKSLEAAGFGWTQVHAPPAAVLAEHRACVAHSAALAESLATTGLRCVIHAPGGLRAGHAGGDRAFRGLLDYAASSGADFVVYHAMALPDAPGNAEAHRREAASLGELSRRAERLGVTIALENLAPLYPGAPSMSADPASLRGLVHRIGSGRVGVCLDIGHAHITSELLRTPMERLCEPVLDVTCLFHVHDNLGARRPGGPPAAGVDPLRLDLHLPPGRGTLPWGRLAARLLRHGAPMVMEVHPPYRPRAADIHTALERALARAR